MSHAAPISLDALDGLLLVDKPSGWTSHDVVAKIRRQFRLPKVGHGGTLAPMATGPLIILATIGPIGPERPGSDHARPSQLTKEHG